MQKFFLVVGVIGTILFIYNFLYGGFLWMMFWFIVAAFNITMFLVLKPNKKQIQFTTQSTYKTGYSSNYGNDVKFPEFDEHGNKLDKVYTNIRLTGTARINDHTRTQTVIKRIKEKNIGIKLVHKEIDGYPYATAVVANDGSEQMAGWLPEMFYHHDDVAEWIINGDHVKAGVRVIDGGTDDKAHYGITIDIARYVKAAEEV